MDHRQAQIRRCRGSFTLHAPVERYTYIPGEKNESVGPLGTCIGVSHRKSDLPHQGTGSLQDSVSAGTLEHLYLRYPRIYDPFVHKFPLHCRRVLIQPEEHAAKLLEPFDSAKGGGKLNGNAVKYFQATETAKTPSCRGLLMSRISLVAVFGRTWKPHEIRHEEFKNCEIYRQRMCIRPRRGNCSGAPAQVMRTCESDGRGIQPSRVNSPRG